MPHLGSRRGAAGGLSLPFMIGAFALIAGFLYWLNVTAVGTAVAVVEVAEEDPWAGALSVEVNVLEANPLQFEGAMLRFSGIDIVSRLGDQAFWTSLPNDQPFLLKLGPLLVSDAVTVSSGDVAMDLVGTVRTMSDSVLDAWEAMGAFAGSQTGRLEAEFAEVFVEIDHLELVPPAPGGADAEASEPPEGTP